MKKIEEILKRERLAENPEFKAMYRDYQESKRKREEARESHRRAKEAYHTAEDGDDNDDDAVTELHHRLRQEKYMARYYREAYRLARHRLRAWIDKFLRRVIDLRDEVGDTLQGAREKKLTGDKTTPRHEMAPTAKTLQRVRRNVKADAGSSARDDHSSNNNNNNNEKNDNGGSGKKKAQNNGRAGKKSAHAGQETEHDDDRSRNRGRKSNAAADHAVRKGEHNDAASDHQAKSTKRRGGKRTPSDD